MGPEGYLINQFISMHTNKRTDQWGGSYENRIRLPIEIIERTREAVGRDFILIYRLSMLDLIPDGSDWSETVQLAKAVERAGATIINTRSAGTRRGCRRSRRRCRAARSRG